MFSIWFEHIFAKGFQPRLLQSRKPVFETKSRTLLEPAALLDDELHTSMLRPPPISFRGSWQLSAIFMRPNDHFGLLGVSMVGFISGCLPRASFPDVSLLVLRHHEDCLGDGGEQSMSDHEQPSLT